LKIVVYFQVRVFAVRSAASTNGSQRSSLHSHILHTIVSPLSPRSSAPASAVSKRIALDPCALNFWTSWEQELETCVFSLRFNIFHIVPPPSGSGLAAAAAAFSALAYDRRVKDRRSSMECNKEHKQSYDHIAEGKIDAHQCPA